MNYWLMKSEPDVFGIHHLKEVGVEPWDGVRNYQARNMMRDDMEKGDIVFFYHSNCAEPGIVGLMTVHREGYPDDTAWDKKSKYYDAKASPENPRWSRVDVKYKKTFKRTISLAELKADPALSDFKLVQKGSRLSIMPVSEQEYLHILNKL